MEMFFLQQLLLGSATAASSSKPELEEISMTIKRTAWGLFLVAFVALTLQPSTAAAQGGHPPKKLRLAAALQGTHPPTLNAALR